MAYTFFKAQGKNTGKSMVEDAKVELATTLLRDHGAKLVLPVDNLVTDSLDLKGRKLGQTKTCSVDEVDGDWVGIDIGPKSVEIFASVIEEAGTVLWNGPTGVFEIDDSAKGTFAVLEAMTRATAKGAVTVIGGGDSAAAAEKAKLEDKVSFVSTGGGASLEFLEGKKLPGVECLDDTYEVV
eukprot:NODE_1305_length_622_cov_213.691383_g1293_i0.p2 GENE.NODE_1305_length_622_cov_213.691383_g1293_i0~~NODE_1305_length_622_cov_213.691383_g1293_i0.p2  ORF type:complete len:193 (-),score=33.70 NODE_1305_length_622_cov_213.691383_g1293_i0:44-589(-)